MLTGKNNEEKIWNYLTAAGLNACGAAGLMGNLYAESGLSPINLQNSFEKKLGYTDAAYTAAVDNGSYTNFGGDWAGYGVAQWTHPDRKPKLLAYAKAARKSIGDLEMQLGFLMQELSTGYKGVLSILKTATTVRAASDAVLLQFERPADQSEAVKVKRAGYGQAYYNKYVGKESKSMTEQELRQKVVSIMQGWLGRKESDGSHKEIIDIYNAHKPLARGYKVKYTDPWCATTVSSAAIVAGFTDIIPTECGCSAMIELFKKLGRWQEDDAYVPSPGDCIFYDWQDGASYAATDNTGAPDHVGIVEKVAGRTITVIEGNYSNAVKRRTLAVNGRYIRGYGVPDYAGKAAKSGGTAQAAASPETKENKATGKARLFDKSMAGTYTVTASGGLHIRNDAGTTAASMIVLPCGTKAQCYGYYTLVNGVKWLYIQVTYQGVKYIGFSSGAHLKKV